MRNTSLSGLPLASALAQPVSPSATGLRYSTRPSASVVTTASPMESMVTSASSFWWNTPSTMGRTRVRLATESPAEPASRNSVRPSQPRWRRSLFTDFSAVTAVMVSVTAWMDWMAALACASHSVALRGYPPLRAAR